MVRGSVNVYIRGVGNVLLRRGYTSEDIAKAREEYAKSEELRKKNKYKKGKKKKRNDEVWKYVNDGKRIYYNYVVNKKGVVKLKNLVWPYNTNRLPRYSKSDGYVRVTICDENDKPHTKSLHRIVAFTFIGKPPEDMENPTVDHINFNKSDNSVKNLRWMEQKENSARQKPDTKKK